MTTPGAALTSVAEKVYSNRGNAAVLAAVPAAGAVLDVGCGAGDNAAVLAGRGAVVDGVTLSAEEARVAEAFCRRVFIHNLEAGLPAEISGPYDAVICSHVLEHICWPEKLLADLHRVLAPHGVLVVALPNLLHYSNRWKLLAGRVEYEPSGLMDNTHFRWYTLATAARLLERHGFMVQRRFAQGSLPLWLLRSILPRSWTARLDAGASRLRPGLFGYQMLLVAQPRRTV